MKSVLALYAALAVFFGFALAGRVSRYPVGSGAALALYVCLMWLVGLALAPGFARTRRWARDRAGLWSLGVFLVPYGLYASATGDFRTSSLATLAGIAVVPLGIYRVAPVRSAPGANWQDLVVLAWLGAPVFLGWIHRIWTVPVNLDFMTRVFLLGVGSWSFVVFRPLDDTGYEFRYSWQTLRAGLLSFAAFSAIGLPLGSALRFIAWNPNWRGAGAFGFDLVTIFLFIALPEELYFRGALQNLLEGTWESRYRAQAAASVIFGFSHILHAPRPNWRYVVLASVAGWFYGSAYRRTRSLMASATTHALVDTVWRTWFQLVRR